jgi:hypothetical protein
MKVLRSNHHFAMGYGKKDKSLRGFKKIFSKISRKQLYKYLMTE